jgi:hypothetical protein
MREFDPSRRQFLTTLAASGTLILGGIAIKFAEAITSQPTSDQINPEEVPTPSMATESKYTTTTSSPTVDVSETPEPKPVQTPDFGTWSK